MPRITKGATTKRARSDSAQTAIRLASAKDPKPPLGLKLPNEAKSAYLRIVRARDPEAWTLVDLEHAVNLACCFADLERLRGELREEPDIVINAKGTQVVNPKHSLLETLSRRAVALSRMLHVHPQATAGPSGEQRKKNSTARKIRDAAGAGVDRWDDDDDLIARH